MLDVVLKRFDAPDEARVFDKGRFEIVRVGGMTIGRATYEPGWRWSVHVGAPLGQALCEVEHVGMVVSGTATAAMRDGRVIEMRAGDTFYIAPGHDSWVVGDEPYVSLHFMGADAYANAKTTADAQEIPIVCNPMAMTPAERVEYARLVERVATEAGDVIEVADGFRLTYASDPDRAGAIARWMTYERKCCPFLSFELDLASDTTLTLHVRGPALAKEILRAALKTKRGGAEPCCA